MPAGSLYSDPDSRLEAMPIWVAAREAIYGMLSRGRGVRKTMTAGEVQLQQTIQAVAAVLWQQYRYRYSGFNYMFNNLKFLAITSTVIL